jgi:spermidine synthase
MRPRGLYVLFFLSGASALVYELIWQRQLHLLFGVSTLAVSAVLTAFLGGLALGALAFGRRADRTPNPLRLYAALEAGIGLSALLVEPGFRLLTGTYTALYAALEPGPLGGTLLRLALALLLLAVPACLLGGTLPVMARLAAARRTSLTSSFSVLYGVNTLGSVAGAALTGFVFLHFVGMQRTVWIAVGVNLTVASVAGMASRRAAQPPGGGMVPGCGTVSDRAAPPTEGLPWRPGKETFGQGRWRGQETTPQQQLAPAVLPSAALAAAALTGAATLGCEVVWSRILGIFTSNSAYAFALLLSVLLLGMGAGSLLQAVWARRRGDAWLRLALCQALLAAVTLALLFGSRDTPDWLARWSGGLAWSMFAGELALTAGLLFVPAVLIGMSFPLLTAGVAADPNRFGGWLGRTYAANTAGCVAGAVGAGFFLIPAVGLRNTLGLCAAANLAASALAWACARRPGPVWRGLAAAGAALGVAVLWLGLPAGGYHKSPPGAGHECLFYREGNNGTVSVLAEEGGRRWLLVDGQPVAGTGRTVVIDQKMLAHLPLLLHPAPRRALTVGFGSGGTSHSMTLHGIDVDCVEIERAVPAAAPLFRSENEGVLADPHFRLVVDDARSWLRVAPTRYDVIVTDCTNIQYRSNADLYSVEYFRLMRDRLGQGGVAAAWVPANGIDPADLKTLLRSFQTAFPHTSVWFMNTLATDFLIVVGTADPLAIEANRLAARMAAPMVRRDLEAVGLAEPCRLLYTFLAADADLAAFVGPGPLNTDDRPLLAYTTYGASFRGTIAANLSGLLTCRRDVGRYVRHAPPEVDMLRHYAASNEALMGHVAHQAGAEAEALGHYLRGARLLPADAALRELVATSYYRLRR